MYSTSQEKLIASFYSMFRLSEEEKKAICNITTEKKIKRKECILNQGEICNKYTFVVEGCFKVYQVDDLGRSHNLLFAVENEWIADIQSFHKKVPSRLYIEAVEPAVILQIQRKDLWNLYNKYHTFDHNFRVIIEDKYTELQNRLLLTLNSNAYDRYQAFVKTYPNLVNRLPNTQIASYLGVTPEFLSKIKSEHLKK